MTDERPARPGLRDRLRRNLATETRERLRPSTDSTENRRSGRPSEPKESAGPVTVQRRLQERLFEELGRRGVAVREEAAVTSFVEDFVERALEEEELRLNADERGRLAQSLVEEALGVGPLAPLMADPAVSDILVNGPDRVYVERFGRIERVDVQFANEDHIRRIIERIAARVGRRIDQSWPMADLRLQDGTRVNATLPPASIDGPTLSIRRFGRVRLRRAELVRRGMLSDDMSRFLDFAVRTRRNVLISGGTGAGKSTFLAAMAEAIQSSDRIITIEDTAELALDQEHVVRLETRPPNVEGRGAISARNLLVNALRMRPSRLIVGEVRGGEALDMLQAMNTGHEGGMSTVHANSSRDALSRLETMVLMAGSEIPSRAVREQITSALHLVVHLTRDDDGVRRVERISELTGMEGTTPLLQDIFEWVPARGGETGRFAATGIVPTVHQRFGHRDDTPPVAMFKRSGSAR